MTWHPALVKTCEFCQAAKISKHSFKITSSTISFTLWPIWKPTRRYIIGALPSVTIPGQSQLTPFKYVLTCIYRSTRWVKAGQMTGITAKIIAYTVLNIWISSFGRLLYIYTDRGTRFEAEIFHELFYCFSKVFIAYAPHPQAWSKEHAEHSRLTWSRLVDVMCFDQNIPTITFRN